MMLVDVPTQMKLYEQPYNSMKVCVCVHCDQRDSEWAERRIAVLYLITNAFLMQMNRKRIMS